MIKVFTDGGARGNPGPAAIGVYIVDPQGDLAHRFAKKIGVATNNVSEYQAVIEAFNWLLEHKDVLREHKEIHFFLDSQLIVFQINGFFKIKNERLRELLLQIRSKQKELQKEVKYFQIPREQNQVADKLVNLALDNKL